MTEYESSQENNKGDLSSAQKDTLHDMEKLRGSSNNKNEVNRLNAYELVYGGTLSSGHDIWSLKDIKKERDTLTPTTQSDEKDNKATEDQLTAEQLEYIMEVEERSGLEFNDYDEAIAWEDRAYEKGDPAEDFER
jgi:hypothetical protein